MNEGAAAIARLVPTKIRPMRGLQEFSGAEITAAPNRVTVRAKPVRFHNPDGASSVKNHGTGFA
ncbi:hypothetical protein [Actimicrobium antarcticum]|uniref:hypothetical protein n=1 Tax=Actimicrobium antarcticum TaxID=1051899 RepID=UPI0031D613BF